MYSYISYFIIGFFISLSLMTPIQADYLSDLQAEVEQGGATVDNSSIVQISREDFEQKFSQKIPGVYKLYQKLDPAQQTQIWKQYTQDLKMTEAAKTVVKFALAKARSQKY